MYRHTVQLTTPGVNPVRAEGDVFRTRGSENVPVLEREAGGQGEDVSVVVELVADLAVLEVAQAGA